MFTSNFTSGVISPAAQGQPIVVAGPIHFFIHIFLLHPAIFNSLAATTQVILGVLILWERTTSIGLIGSIGWGLFVWVIGEGYGGIFSTHTILLMGAPGAALIYVILAIAVLPKTSTKRAVIEDQRPAPWLAIVWALLWIGGAIYQLLPGQNSVSNVSAMIAGNGAGQPGWLASIDNNTASFINRFSIHTTSIANMHMSARQMLTMQTQGQSGYWFILLLAFIQFAVGVAIFLPRYYRNVAISIGIVVSVLFWVIGQSFGGVFTGLATDPNAAILFILLGVAIIGCSNPSKYVSRYLDKLEGIVT
jgi:hypothetical protein